LEITNQQYKKYLNFARKLTRNKDADELLHEVVMKILAKKGASQKISCSSYVYLALRNTMYDPNSTYNKLQNPKPVRFEQEKTELPEYNHIFVVLEQLKQEGKAIESDVFLQAYFSSQTQKQIANKIGRSMRYVAGCCSLVKTEIRKRYEFNKHDTEFWMD
jgi:DNA-directed RNA polymerase specialized sigma24 family protein